MSVTSIHNEALGLPAQERAKLIDALWDSLSNAEIKSREAAWANESERRITAFETGQLQATDSEVVFTELRKGLRR